MDLGGRLTAPEQVARHNIDRMLALAGWSVQDSKDLDFTASRGVALRGFPLEAGFADYMLFADRQAIGIVEAKKEGTTLNGYPVEEVPRRTSRSCPEGRDTTTFRLRGHGSGDGVSRRARSRLPLQAGVLVSPTRDADGMGAGTGDTAGAPERDAASGDSWPAGVPGRGYRGLEHSFSENRLRSLIQMATGSGKTFTAVSFSYRLIKHAEAKRVLFLVDRANLGRQTLK
jgi:type I restriction enzyme, R subunit